MSKVGLRWDSSRISAICAPPWSKVRPKHLIVMHSALTVASITIRNSQGILGSKIDRTRRLCSRALPSGGEACFSRLVGDWALALWSENDQCLYLARDHAGTRTLYFHHAQSEVTWATYLDAFRTKDMPLRLSHDYAACYLAGRFVYDLTPYEGVRAVPPAHYVKIRGSRVSLHRHWSPAVKAMNLYDTDTDYEARFLTLFHQSVARRTGPGAPILAQLSGGIGFNRHRLHVR